MASGWRDFAVTPVTEASPTGSKPASAPATLLALISNFANPIASVKVTVKLSSNDHGAYQTRRPSLWLLQTIVLWSLALVGIGLGLVSLGPVARADDAEAAGVRHTISVFYSSLPTDNCNFTGAAKAIEHFVAQRVATVNRLADYRGHRIDVVMYDDRGKPNEAIANVRKAMADPTTLAMVGLSGSARSKAVFETLGKEIGSSNIPFITDGSVTELFQPYGNVFTMRPSQEDERVPVLGRFLKDGGFQKPVFAGMADNISIDALVTSLAALPNVPAMVATHRLTMKDNQLEVGQLTPVIESVKAQAADILLVAVGTEPSRQVLKEITAANLAVPVMFVLGSDATLKSAEAAAYGNDLYQVAWDTLPDVYNNRLREQILKTPNDRWIFEDTKNEVAEGWKTGVCKAADQKGSPSILASSNVRAIGRGTQYADMVGLIGDVARAQFSDQSLPVLRGQIIETIKADYVSGVGAYRGAFDNWSFRPSSRGASRTPSIVMRSRGANTVQLAPTQYARLRNDALRPIQTIYMDIDVTRVFRVNDEEKSFFAEFYMSLRGNDQMSFDNIDFGNAFSDTAEKNSNVKLTVLHDGSPSGVYPEGVKLVKVVGKFMMTPDLSTYPFDTQLFTIQLKPKSGDQAFIIQPPAEKMRDSVIDADGWSTLDHYVGYDEDYIPVSDARTGQRSIVPFYKMNFSWVMKRETTDYYLRVVIPLIFILIVAYLSIFIPREHFEAIVTIQVTALLSAVALYFSIPKVGSDVATVSDRIFLFYYMAVSLMIAISILRVSPRLRGNRFIDRLLSAAHIVGMPVLVVSMMLYVSRLDTGYLPAISIVADQNSKSATKASP